MGSIIKGTLLLLCAMAWAGAGPLPRPSPCPPDRSVTPNTFAQYRQMLETFRHVVNNTDDLRKRAQAYFKDIDQHGDFLAQLVQYYYRLAQFASRTGVSLNEEEQLELKLQPSFHPQLNNVKEKLLNGTITLRKELVTSGYGCVEDLHSNSTTQLEVPSICPTRYIGLVKVIAQLNTASAHVESLLLLARSEKKE